MVQGDGGGAIKYTDIRILDKGSLCGYIREPQGGAADNAMRLQGTVTEETLTRSKGWQKIPGARRWVLDLELGGGKDPDILDRLQKELEKAVGHSLDEGEGEKE